MDEPDLATTLRTLLASGTETNPALESLVRDYARFHLTLVAVGATILLGVGTLALFTGQRFLTSPRRNGRWWSFERWTYLVFSAGSLVLGLGLTLVVVANLLNALDPRQGFAGTVDMLGSPRPGSSRAVLHQAFTAWLQSGRSPRPALVQAHIDDRLAWQRPKAAVTSLLFVTVVGLALRAWRTLVRQSRDRVGRWSGRDRATLGAGVGLVLAALVLMLMVLGNTQASVAPLTMVLLFG